MVSSCCVLGCTERASKDNQLSFHSFPSDEERRQLWVSKLGRKNFKASSSTKICSKHFTPSCFDTKKLGGTWLKKTAVPTLFSVPAYLQAQSEVRNPPEEEQDETDSFPEPERERRKRKYFIGDFKEEDMACPINACQLLKIARTVDANCKRTIKNLRRENGRLKKRMCFLKEVLTDRKKKALISSTASDLLESPGTPTSAEEEKDPIPLDPAIRIKEEPVEYNPNPSTSTDTNNGEFILPYEENNIWTPAVLAASETKTGPRFTLSVASLAIPNVKAETPEDEQLRKKPKISKTFAFVPTTNGSELRPPRLVCNSGEPSSSGSSKEPRLDDQFDAFGEYIAAQLRSLDRRSCAYAQMAIGDIISEAKTGKFLPRTLIPKM